MQDISDQDRTTAGAPPPALVQHWRAQLPAEFPSAARWRALAGGRTNAVWQVRGGPQPLVVKLYRAEAHTPLFANDPDAEAASLSALSATGLAPDFVAAGITPAGRSLVYRHVAGRPWAAGDDPRPVAQALGRLHAHPLPDTLSALPTGPARLRDTTLDICAELDANDASPLRASVTQLPDLAPAFPAFIHGDATAGNTLVTSDGITFIDWQCPAIGDPADDLAVFLSPAMQLASGNVPLSPEDEARFLDSYAVAAPHGAQTVARYRATAPLYRARMAAYALWRLKRGEVAYAAAAAAELARLRSPG